MFCAILCMCQNGSNKTSYAKENVSACAYSEHRKWKYKEYRAENLMTALRTDNYQRGLMKKLNRRLQNNITTED